MYKLVWLAELSLAMGRPEVCAPKHSPLPKKRWERRVERLQAPCRALLLCIFVVFSTTLLVLLLLCRNKPYCLLNKLVVPSEEVKELIETNKRDADEAQAYLEGLLASRGRRVLEEFWEKLRTFKSIGEAEARHRKREFTGRTLLIAVVTISRPRNPRYLIQVVASLIRQVLEEPALPTRHRRFSFERNRNLHGQLYSALFVFAADCFDGDLSGRPELELLSKLVPVLTRNSKTQPLASKERCKDLQRVYELKYCERIIQESEDYVLLLQTALAHRPDLVLALEDDAVALPLLLPKLDRLLQARCLATWAFIKLAYPLKWSGFEKYSLHWLAALCLLVGACSVAIAPFFIKWKRSQWERHKWLLYKTQAVLCLIGATYVVILLEVIGRQSILGWMYPYDLLHSVMPSKGCCTQAQLFSQSSANFYVEKFLQEQRPWNSSPSSSVHFKSAPVTPIDLWLDNVPTPEGKWMVEPIMFRHIGTISSLGKGDRITD